MSGLLSLKWNNHSSVFLNLLQSLRLKELYCDTTIVCHGKFYPVHKLVLSTCSEYFEAIFGRIECKHPFIIMKDIEPPHLEALLNYMYKGEVNVLQESLPGLIKAAEALKIKGLAVPDDSVTKEKASPLREKRRNTHGTQSLVSQPTKVRRVEQSSEHREDFSPPADDSSRITAEANIDQSHLSPKAGKENTLSSHYNDGLGYNAESDHDSLSNANFQVSVKSEPPESNKSPDIIPKEEISSFNFASLLPSESEDLKSHDDQVPGVFTDEPPSQPPPPPPPLAPPHSSSESFTDQFTGGLPGVREDLNFSWNEERPRTSSEQEISRSLVASEEPSSDTMTSHHLVKHGRKALRRSLGGDTLPSLTSNPFPTGLSPFRHKCSFCSYGSYSSSAVRKHEMRIHTGVKPFSCSICHYSSTTKEGLRIHIRSHTGEKPYHCPHCSHKASCYANIKKHTKSVHKLP